MEKNKTIAVVTGIRSEYHILQPVMRAIENHPHLSLQVIVTGTHLRSDFGNTWKLVNQDFKITAKIPSLYEGNQLVDRARSLGRQTEALSRCFEKLDPDMICVLGDREESLAVSSACTFLNRACVHISGGDRSFGSIDDIVRHAVTKLSHLHLPTTQENRQRIVKLGEETWRVKAVGASGLDRLKETKKISRKQLMSTVGLEDEDFVVVLQHPLSSEVKQAAQQMKLTLQSIKKSGLASLVIYPNSDAGSQDMIQVISDFKKPKNWKVHTTLESSIYVNALRHAVALVGNSSAGLLEAPFMSCPAINIGTRQSQRTSGKNLIRVPHNKEKILKALKKAKNKRFREELKQPKNRFIYGDGNTGKRIAKILANTPINDKLLNKKITY